MIYIQKNQLNNLVFTLNEKKLVNNSNTILELYSNSNKKKAFFFLAFSADTSQNQTRWNQWQFLENGLEQGSYDYTCYETSGTTVTPVVSGLTITETGKAVVIGSGSTLTIPTISDNLTQYTFE